MATWPTAAGRRRNNFCCVTTRRRIRRGLCWLRQRLGTLPARTLCFGVLRLGRCSLASAGLSLRRLPEAEQTAALGILAVTLVPAPRLVLAPTPFVQADPRARSANSGQTAVVSLNVVGAHGRCNLPRKSSGRMGQRSPRALSKRESNDYSPV
jgi:hypothetical protein